METFYIVIAITIFGLIFDYTNGFHDAANAVSTVIATGALKPRIAVILSGAFNTLGAFWISGVAKTVAEGIVPPHMTSEIMVLAAVIGAIVWNLLTWYFGLPSSSSYALIGGLLGAAIIQGGIKDVIWKGLFIKVILPMTFSPILGFMIAFFMMKGVMKIEKKYGNEKLSPFFRRFQLGSASIMALAHGVNDAQKSMGIITLGLFSGGLIASIKIPFWVIIACAFFIGLGTATGGYRIIHTMGYKIAPICPSQGFTVESSSALVILLASAWGMPVSSTQMVAGGITGAGAAKKISGVKWMVIYKIIWTWVLTLPGAGIISSCIYFLFKSG